SDQTVARVRNLRWRGEWPRQLPPPREQELADHSLQDELADGPVLPLVFEHDFSEGLPTNRIWGGGREGWHFRMQELPEGVRIANPGGWYAQQTLSLPLQVEGDFDIAVEYEDLQSMVAPGGEGHIQLEVIFADSVETDFRLYRKHHHRQNGRHDQVVSVGLLPQPEKHTHRAWHGQPD